MAAWSLVVTLNNIDVSARLIGEVSVEAEESTARLGAFVMLPLPGNINAGDWIGTPVQIDYIQDPGPGEVVTRLFSGKVNRSSFDPATHFVAFSCTDNLQGHFEAMSEAQILQAIPDGVYSSAVFGEREDGWQQAQDVLSTVKKAYDLNRDGITAGHVDWAAKTSADYSYDETQVIDETIEIELIRLRDLINKVSLSAQYRFTRLHHRIHSFGWSAEVGTNAGFDFCDYYANSYELPTKDMIQGAGAAGWQIQDNSIAFDSLPPSGGYLCNGNNVAWTINDELLNQL